VSRNVEAIRAILDEVVEAMRKAAPPNVVVGDYATDFLAECLDARGVVAPAARRPVGRPRKEG